MFPVVPAVDEVSSKLTAPHVDTVVVDVITGVGFTVTLINVGAADRQDPMVLGEVGRTEYTALPGVLLLVFVSTSLIVLVMPLVAPEIPDCSELSPHVKVLPGMDAVSGIFS